MFPLKFGFLWTWNVHLDWILHLLFSVSHLHNESCCEISYCYYFLVSKVRVQTVLDNANIPGHTRFSFSEYSGWTIAYMFFCTTFFFFVLLPFVSKQEQLWHKFPEAQHLCWWWFPSHCACLCSISHLYLWQRALCTTSTSRVLCPLKYLFLFLEKIYSVS